MKIKRLKIENFRGIVDDTIDFDPSFTVFAGRNGGGPYLPAATEEGSPQYWRR